MRRAILQDILTARRAGRVLVRVLDLDSGEEQLIDPARDTSSLGCAAAQAAGRDASGHVTLDGRRLFLTVYNTPWEIVIMGAVHIAQALAGLALAAGYRVRVIDPRAPYATEERFAGITLVREWPDDALMKNPLTARSALVALAHDPKLDDAALAAAIRSPAFYVGALGSARTQSRRLERLTEAGFASQDLARIRGPVGLAIGARTPGEIAIAILAELVQARRAPKPQRIAGILLAAGASSRMGANKLTLPFKGKPMVRHAADAALAAGLDPLIVVTGHEAAAMRDALTGAAVQFVHNAYYADGLSTSLRAGLAAVPAGCDGAMILLGDMPAVTPQIITRVIAAFDPGAGRAICVATAADGRRGHPVLWGQQFFPEICALSGDQGARALMEAHSSCIAEVDAGSDAPLIDIDTPEALKTFSACPILP
jgi:CTP:molybdopterin cytidylyltransferase MocA/xanthine/CO dehydrogenase XdhC/CoxF family maturation factor